MAEKLIDIAGKLHAATVEGILADSEQISYGDSNVKTTLDELKSGTTGGLLTLDVESIDMDKSTLTQIITTKKAARYILTKEGSGEKLFNCGVIDMFSDSMGHGITQVLTTNFTMEDGEISFEAHTDDKIYQYWRYYHLQGGTTDVPTESWSGWNLLNSSDIQEQVANLLGKSSIVEFSGIVEVADENLLDQSAVGAVYIYFNSKTNAFVATNSMVTGGSTKYYTNWPDASKYGVVASKKGAVPYKDVIYVASDEAKNIYSWNGSKFNLMSSAGTVSQEFGNSTTQSISQKTLTTKINELEDAIFPVTASLSASPTIAEVSVETPIKLSWSVNRKGSSIIGDCTLTLDDEPVSGSSTTKNVNESSPTQKTYTLKATYNSKVVTATTRVNIVGAMYFGFAAATAVAGLTITGLGKQSLKTSPGGTYTLQSSTEGHYMWLCVPNNMTVNRVTLNGFDVPMEAASTKEQGTLTYKCYRSSNALVQGSYTIIIS